MLRVLKRRLKIAEGCMDIENHNSLNRKKGSDSFVGGFNTGVQVGDGRLRVVLQADPLGRDWLLRITGGEAHVGAVATAGHGQVQLSVVGSHKEGPLAEVCAEQWSLLTGRVCVAVVGIHQDQATRQEIDSIVDHVRQGLDVLAGRWKEIGDAE